MHGERVLQQQLLRTSNCENIFVNLNIYFLSLILLSSSKGWAIKRTVKRHDRRRGHANWTNNDCVVPFREKRHLNIYFFFIIKSIIDVIDDAKWLFYIFFSLFFNRIGVINGTEKAWISIRWRLYGFQEHDKFPSINIVDCFIFSTRCVVVGIAGGISYIFRREWNLNGHSLNHFPQWPMSFTLNALRCAQ